MPGAQARMAVLFDEALGAAEPAAEKVEEPIADLAGVGVVHVAHDLNALLTEHQVVEAINQLAQRLVPAQLLIGD